MKIISFEDLYHTEFYLTEPFALAQHWFHRGSHYSCIGLPKASHTFLWLKNCRAQVTDKAGRVLRAKKGQLLYMARDLEYTVDFKDTVDGQDDSFVFHFQLYDLQHNALGFADHPIVCLHNVDIATAMDLERLVAEFQKNVVCMPDILSIFYHLLAVISATEHNNIADYKYAYIKAGIEILENDDQDMKIKDIAQVCGVSECYFRKIFREYSGLSPSAFRQNCRIEKAKLLLATHMLTVGQIAEKLHYVDIYHFSKAFKQAVGVSPKQYIQNVCGTEIKN